jgi:hypothetical protein
MGAGREAGWRKARLTSELARFLAVSCWKDIPATIRREGKRAILNITGCIVAGRGTTRFVASPEHQRGRAADERFTSRDERPVGVTSCIC